MAQQAYTVIVKLPSDQYTIGVTTDVSTFMKQQRGKSQRGYYHHKDNVGRAKVVFCVKGDFRKQIKSMGIVNFIKVMDSYEPFHDAIGQLQ